MEKRVVLVTGASRGIGTAIALRLAREGYHIWLNYKRNHEKAQAQKKLIEDMGGTCTLVPFDVAKENEILEALEPLLERETPYALVHNAGITRDQLLALMSTEDWRAIIETNLNSFFFLARLMVKAMLPKRKGRIVVISSVSGETGQAGQCNYSAAKAGLIGMVKALAREVAKRNILVNAVTPGLIETDMTAGLPKDKLLPMIPMGRFGSPEEVAGVVNFLLSEDASYITGQVIRVNGGLYM